MPGWTTHIAPSFHLPKETFSAQNPLFGQGSSGGKEVWVFSRTLRQEDHPGLTIVHDDIVARLAELRSRPGKDIALYGGGGLARSLMELDQVDTVELAIVPVLLGGGIPLIPAPGETRNLTLTRHTVFPKTGTILLQYDVLPRKAKRSRKVRQTRPEP